MTSELKTTKRITTNWALKSWRVQQSCDVAVLTICVPSDAPVSRSCKTYPVTQTKRNKWTGEASLRPGKCKMRSCVLWRSRVLWRHLEGIWWNDDIGAEDYKKNNYELSCTVQSWRGKKVVCDLAVRTKMRSREYYYSVVCDVAVRTKMRSRVWSETSWGDMVKW